MLSSRNDDRLYVIGVQERSASTDTSQITFLTTRGELHARLRMHRGMKQAVILLGGDSRETGFEPAFDLLDSDLAARDIGAVRLDYRCPGDCAQCAIDTLLACQYLDDEGIRDVILVGWSFGASVAAAAGSVARNVRGVAAISAREATETCARRLRSKPILLLHGEKDKITPVESVSRIRARVDSPSRLIIYPGAGHDLKEVRQKVNEDLVDWLTRTLDPSQLCLSNPAQQPVS
jgi:alpha/beta superfamily hydrolase